MYAPRDGGLEVSAPGVTYAGMTEAYANMFPASADTAATLDAIRALLIDNARLRHEEARLHGEVDHLRRELDAARPVQRAKERALRVVRRSAAGRALHRAYRLARGRSSRSA